MISYVRLRFFSNNQAIAPLKIQFDHLLWKKIKTQFAIFEGGSSITCDQSITPAKNERVCNISFSASRPMTTKNSPDLCNQQENQTKGNLWQQKGLSKTNLKTHLPKPWQHPKAQNCRVHQYSYKLMNKMEVAIVNNEK